MYYRKDTVFNKTIFTANFTVIIWYACVSVKNKSLAQKKGLYL